MDSVLAWIVQRAFSRKAPSFLLHAEQHMLYLQVQLVESFLHPGAGLDEFLDLVVWAFHGEATRITQDL